MDHRYDLRVKEEPPWVSLVGPSEVMRFERARTIIWDAQGRAYDFGKIVALLAETHPEVRVPEEDRHG